MFTSVTSFESANSKLTPLTLATCRTIGKTFKNISIKSSFSTDQKTIGPDYSKITETKFSIYSWCQERGQSMASKQLMLFKARQKNKKMASAEESNSIEKAKQNLFNIFTQFYMLLQIAVAKANSEFLAFSESLVAAMGYVILMLNKIVQIKKTSDEEDSNVNNKEFSFAKNNYLKKNQANKVKPLTLVLDLDETLVHSTKIRPEAHHEPLIIEQNNGKYSQVFLRRRPYLNLFLEKMSEFYNLVIFTASQMAYADPVLDLIDENLRISKRLYRQSCERINNKWVKDLRKLGADLNQVILIDNEEIAASYQPENYMYIQSWYECEKDCELLRCMEILQKWAMDWSENCNEKKDIRKFIMESRKESRINVGNEAEIK